jgi:hypothetical protein
MPDQKLLRQSCFHINGSHKRDKANIDRICETQILNKKLWSYRVFLLHSILLLYGFIGRPFTASLYQ